MLFAMVKCCVPFSVHEKIEEYFLFVIGYKQNEKLTSRYIFTSWWWFRVCNKLVPTIPTTTDKPIYLPCRAIPWQLQGEVWKCLDMWLCHGIMRPSKDPYTSHIVNGCKKNWWDQPLCGLLEIKFKCCQRHFSYAMNRWGTASSSLLPVVLFIWSGTRLFPDARWRSRC